MEGSALPKQNPAIFSLLNTTPIFPADNFLPNKERLVLSNSEYFEIFDLADRLSLDETNTVCRKFLLLQAASRRLAFGA